MTLRHCSPGVWALSVWLIFLCVSASTSRNHIHELGVKSMAVFGSGSAHSSQNRKKSYGTIRQERVFLILNNWLPSKTTKPPDMRLIRPLPSGYLRIYIWEHGHYDFEWLFVLVYCRFRTNTLDLSNAMPTCYETMNLCTFCINVEALGSQCSLSFCDFCSVFLKCTVSTFLLFINLKVRFYGYFSYAGNEVLTFSGSKIELLFFFFTFVTYVTSVFSTILIKL